MTTSAICYIRASTSAQRQKNSLAVQKSVIENYCERNGFEIVDVSFEYCSGLKQRPLFDETLARCVAEGHVLVCLSPSRMTRDLGMFAALGQEELDSLRFTTLGPESPSLVILGVLISIAAAEAQNTSFRIRNTYKHLKEIHGDDLRWGSKDTTKAREKAMVSIKGNARVHNERVSKAVRGFQSQGMSMTEIVDLISQLGIKTRRGNQYTSQNLYRVVRAAA